MDIEQHRFRDSVKRRHRSKNIYFLTVLKCQQMIYKQNVLIVILYHLLKLNEKKNSHSKTNYFFFQFKT